MKIISTQKWLLAILALAGISTQTFGKDCYAHTIFVPRQMAYNPMYEDALVFDEYAQMNEHFLVSAKPFYTQTIGGPLKRYFNINHLCSMNVEEDGSGKY